MQMQIKLMHHDFQHWGWLLVWSTDFKRCSLRSSNLSGWEVDIHHQVSFLKVHVLVINQLLYFRFECVAILQRFWIHQLALHQRLYELIVHLKNWIKRSISSFQVVSRPMLVLTLILISSTFGLLIWMRSDPRLLVRHSRHCWFLIRIVWHWKKVTVEKMENHMVSLVLHENTQHMS